MRERYDPNKPVCENQDDFNEAVRKAIKYNNKESMKKAQPWLYVYVVLWMIFLVWGVILAMQIPAGQTRLIHLVFAIVFSPVYVLSYYLGMFMQKPMSVMGFRSAGFGCGMNPSVVTDY